MILKILGCGTSTGVPVPACSCPVCTSGNPKNDRLRTSALVTAVDGRNVLIDTSPDLRQQSLRYGIKKLDAVLYTHEHSDHVAGIDDLRGFCFVAHSAIPCYGSAETLRRLRRRYEYIFSPDTTYDGGLLPKLDLHEVTEGLPFTAAGIEILPLALPHGRFQVTGYRFGKLAYATDCNAIPPAARALLEGVETLIIAGLRYEPHPTHFTIDQAIAAAAEVGAKRAVLIHMTHSVIYDEVSRKLPKGVELAYDGMEIDF